MMKYQRMTKKWVDDNGNNRVKCNISNVEQCEIVCDICDECWVGKINRRLCELEDKIESGELISTKQVGDTEIEFFVNHNETVRENTAKDIFSWVYKNLVNMNFVTGNVEINLPSLDTFAKTYGVDVFDIFKQGEKQ